MVKCPFCGAEMEVDYRRADVIHETDDYYTVRRQYTYECPNCNTEIHHIEQSDEQWDDQKW